MIRKIRAKGRRYWLDVGERVGWTFLAAFGAIWLGPVIADSSDGALQPETVAQLVDLAVLQKAALAGLAAVITAGKAIAFGFFGNEETASSLPTPLDPATPPVDGPAA